MSDEGICDCAEGIVFEASFTSACGADVYTCLRGDAENAGVEISAQYKMQGWKMQERKHRENVWITKAADSLRPQVDTNTDTDDADEMEDVSAASAAPTAVDGNMTNITKFRGYEK